MNPLPPRSNLGVIGLGIIGSRIANVLSNAGYTVWVWNRTPKPVPRFLGTPCEVARNAKLIQIFVKDGPALFSVLEQMLGALTPAHVVANHATILPAEARQAAAMLEKTGSRFLDAPFTGSRDAAQNGQLVYYVGGELADLELARPLLALSAKEILHIGAIGDASLVKIATNLITAASVAALSEALALVQESGVPVSAFAAALAHNASCSETLRMKLPCMENCDFAPRFSLENMVKDMELAARLLSEKSLPSGQVQAFLERARTAIAIGAASEDFSSIHRTSHA